MANYTILYYAFFETGERIGPFPTLEALHEAMARLAKELEAKK